MSLLDFITGGENSAAEDALRRGQQAFEDIQVPSASQLSLPELQQFVQAGILTPAQAQTALQQGNAYNDIRVDPSSMETEQKALGELGRIVSDQGMTPEMQAQLTSALDQAGTAGRGANEAITEQFAQRGVPSSLMAEAAMRDEAGNNARTANLVGTQAAGQAEANALNALTQEGNLAGQIHGQNYGEAANRAAAENAMRQWNAGATNTANLTNAGYQQAANTYNQENRQNVSNQNTGLANERTVYNANVPEMQFNNRMSRAGGIAGVSENQANQAMQSGNQMMGLIGAGVGAVGNMMAPGAGTAMTALNSPAGWQNGPPASANTEQYAPPGYDEGGKVPGEAEVSGDSKKNDKVHAMLSPGEVVVPRSIAPHPEQVKRFVQHLMYQKPPVKPVHPEDVHAVLEALTRRRA